MISRSLILNRLQRMEWVMALCIALLFALGVAFIYSACYRSESLPVNTFYQKQVVWALVGVVAALGLALFDYRRMRALVPWIYAAGLFMLVLVLFVGTELNGARRWLNIFGFYLQPAEVMKLILIVTMARFLSRPGRDLRHPRVLLQAGLLAGVPFLLIMKQPDLGTAAMLLPITLVMLFVAGVPIRLLALVGLIGLLLLPVAWFGLDGYQQERLLVFFDPGRDPLGAGWNKIQSEIAVGSGGLYGKGLLKGTQNILGFLPRTVAPTDFIFSVIAEEWGFMGSTLLLVLYSGLLLSGLRAGMRSRDDFGRLLAVGVMTMLFSHVFVNVAMTIGLMPITGLPLPLISYGGSFMVSTMMALGIVQSVYIRRQRR